MDDKEISKESLEFLNYVWDSTDNTAELAKGNLVKNIHMKVQDVKNDISVEVEFMTLLERDREKIEEGREEGLQEGIQKGKEEGKEEGILLTKKVLKLFNAGHTIQEIAKECEISENQVKKIIE